MCITGKLVCNNKVVDKLAEAPVSQFEKETPTFLDKLLLLDKQAKKPRLLTEICKEGDLIYLFTDLNPKYGARNESREV